MMAYRTVVIRNKESGLVLDASEFALRIREYSGSPFQLWRLESLGDGRFYIFSEANRQAMTICAGQVTTSRKNDGIDRGVNELWYVNADNTITCAGTNLALSVMGERYQSGNKVVASIKTGYSNQKFDIY